LLGSSETINGFSELFAVEDKTHKLYSRRDPSVRTAVNLQPKGEAAESKAVSTKARAVDAGLGGELEAQKEAEHVLLARYSPAGVLLNEALEALQFHGPIGHYLEVSPGRVHHKILKLVREGLLAPVRTALQQAKAENKPARVENVAFRYDGQTRQANVEVIPLNKPKQRCWLLVFEPANVRGVPAEELRISLAQALPPELAEAHQEITLLRSELAAAREYQQSITEQYEAANEELQAANEEGQSSNEELQSINEELETTKEELQSTNEELVTVNEEMGSRNLELHRINSDLNNVLDGVQMCIVVLGGDLCIRRFTPLAEKILNLVVTDVGRPITNIRPNF